MDIFTDPPRDENCCYSGSSIDPSVPSCEKNSLAPIHKLEHDDGGRITSAKMAVIARPAQAGGQKSPSQGDDIVDHESRVDRATAMKHYEEGFLAFGTIKLVVRTSENEEGEGRVFMRGCDHDEEYPGVIIPTAVKRGWVRISDLSKDQGFGFPRLKVYIMPEDVDRGNRGTVRDFQKTVKWLLNFVDCSIDAWVGVSDPISLVMTYQSQAQKQEESLFYIFNTLDSPRPDLASSSITGYGRRAVSEALENNIIGLKTSLYPYQQRSVAAMAHREAEPAKVLDSRKQRVKDIFDHSFYLDPIEGTLLKDAPLYTEPQGGILAETMGYGKTLICIALILATRGHYPKVPQDQVDELVYEPRKSVGSLLSMVARRAKHEGFPWKNDFGAFKLQGYDFDNILSELDKYERAYAEPIFTPTTPGRKGKRQSYNLVRLCSATLVIVPANLLLQWQQEIQRHVKEGALDVLVIETDTREFPSWKELLKYDVVLMTKARFEQEYRDDDLNQGKSRRGDARYQSPLTQVRWLRVICDEGHGFAGSSCRTNAMAMLDKMYIERRWVVSGTPSSTLHGVEVNLSTSNTTSTENDLEKITKGKGALHGRRNSISRALQNRKLPSMQKQEAKDLERLRLIVVNFLHLKPWANQRGSDNASWKKYLNPVTSHDGRHLSSPALREVLQTLILRHRISDIDKDLQLPALHNKVVYLQPSYYDKLAINMFGLVLASNFITSEREDEDYMFHPKNRRKFDLLINNLRQATFQWVGFSEEHVKETLKISYEYLNKNLDKVSDSDSLMLTEGILNGERALNDASWLAFSKLHEIGVYVEDFPDHARDAWALDGRGQNPTLLGTVQARETQKFIRNRFEKATQDVTSGLAGAGIKAMKNAHDKAEEELKQTSKKNGMDGEKQSIGAIDEPKLKAPAQSSSSTFRSSKSSKARPIKPETQKRKRDSISMQSSRRTETMSDETIDNSNIYIPTSTIAGFTSAKLTYLASQLLIHSPDSKSIVFYSHPNTAFFIAEALELLQISHRIYASTLTMAQRNTYLQLFNTDDSIRVLLMDLKQAGQGLHIAAANRVYIVAPIWEDGVQSQAIKRAHRIGQTRDVYVETLVLKGTFEEELIRRRQEIDKDPAKATATVEETTTTTRKSSFSTQTGSEVSDQTSTTTTKSKQPRVTPNNKTQSLLDDRHMVQVLKNIQFLKFDESEQQDVRARMAEMQVSPERRLLFGALRPRNSAVSVSVNATVDDDDDYYDDDIDGGNSGCFTNVASKTYRIQSKKVKVSFG